MILGVKIGPMMLKNLRTTKTEYKNEGRVYKVEISKRKILQEIEGIKDFGCYPKSNRKPLKCFKQKGDALIYVF